MKRASGGKSRGSERGRGNRSSDDSPKSNLRSKGSKGFLCHEDSRIFKFVLFQWINKWAYLLFNQYVEPYMLHPLPVSDQILYWQPIFSKHVSNGLIRSEFHRATRPDPRDAPRGCYKSVLLRALFLTFWRRSLFVVVALITANVLSMSIAFLFKPLLQVLSDRSANVFKTLVLFFFIIFLNLLDGLVIDNLNFYIFRLIYIVHYLFSIGIFQHGLSHRRKIVDDSDSFNGLKICNEVVHSCSPDSECSKNPLLCPARCHQNSVRLKVFSLEFNDSYNISLFFESLKYIIEFLSNMIYGLFLLSLQIKAKLWTLYSVGSCFIFFMFFVELVSTYTLDFILSLRDYRKTKCSHIFGSLSLVKKMFYDDIAINIINECRNNELSLFLIRVFLSFFNMALYTVSINVSFYILHRYFVKSVNDASVIRDIDTASSMVTFYIFMKIVGSMFLIPRAIHIFGMSYVSFKILDRYVEDCPPNFYLSDKTSSSPKSSTISEMTNRLPKDVVVYYKDASFSWVSTRENLLKKNYEPLLRNVNFELKRGQMAIVTGSQGSGKSNFIKSILGEMTLVGGSMAVVPLHTSMPIFYASQDIWLQQGSIRSNIVFGYKFDEQLYNTVLKAVELHSDISSWEKGDLRVVSDNDHSLSSGQRARIEMARAIYAYLIFHRVNSEYNGGKCSFLVCLDSSLQYPDPFLSTSIFFNLFNLRTGLLVNDDLSVVFSSTKRALDVCSKFSDLSQFPDPPIYNIKDRKLTFYSNLHDFIRNKSNGGGQFKYFTSSYSGPYYMSFFSSDMLRLCSSGLKTKFSRIELTKEKNKSLHRFPKDDLGDPGTNPFRAYLSPAIGTFMVFLLLTLAIIIMDNVKYVFATNLSDYIAKHINSHKEGRVVDMVKIRSRTNLSMKVTTLFVSAIVLLSLLSSIFMTTFSMISSRKIHEYCVNSIFKHSSSVIKIKRDIGSILNYLSSDTKIIDEDVGYNFTLFLIYLIQTLINIATLFYLIPISIPFLIATFVIVYKFVLLKLINYSKNIHFAYLESTTQMNSICENAVSGSSIYRSFKKESELITNIIEQADHKMRCRFLFRSVLIWASVLFNWIFSLTTLSYLAVLILMDKFTKFKLKVGYFGLALTLSLTLIRSFDKFSLMYSKFKISVSSVYKFRNFIPPGEKVKFDKFANTHEEYLVSPTNRSACDLDEQKLLQRRAVEFKSSNRRFYALKKLFYHPKITILDTVNYLAPEHSRVSLKNVCVYTNPEHNLQGMILKNISASAHRSDIIGIIGKTGSGKATLLSVLQNIVSNRTGQVHLDGRDLNRIPRVVLRQIIGVLPQLPFVFKGWTVRRLLDPRKLFSDAEIKDALDKCGLLNFVNKLPGLNALDTVIVPDDESPGSLSPGRQSNAITGDTSPSSDFNFELVDSGILLPNAQIRSLLFARLVLYRNFYRMMVIDEPPEEDLVEDSNDIFDLGVRIYELLAKYFSHCTTFVSAHDSKVLKNCNTVWVIHEGSLVRVCKASDIAANESIASIIEQNVKHF
ncbi:hypothetical protein MACJ_002381 [Theileria orientalis]|uniref:ABC transporter n=1 Tax=Theileria orientalis TaxID=68886 RepID=A0A976M639_THEOR|nr:hypothetical protein MACJ_002381 [Theileria orientalis]